MIERKDVRHIIDGNEFMNEYSLRSMLTVTISTRPWKPSPEMKRDNEESIRRKLYGDIHQELIKLRYDVACAANAIDAPVLIERIDALLAKLEWRE